MNISQNAFKCLQKHAFLGYPHAFFSSLLGKDIKQSSVNAFVYLYVRFLPDAIFRAYREH